MKTKLIIHKNSLNHNPNHNRNHNLNHNRNHNQVQSQTILVHDVDLFYLDVSLLLHLHLHQIFYHDVDLFIQKIKYYLIYIIKDIKKEIFLPSPTDRSRGPPSRVHTIWIKANNTVIKIISFIFILLYKLYEFL